MTEHKPQAGPAEETASGSWPGARWLIYLASGLAMVFFLVYLLQIRDQPFLKHLVANPLVYHDEAIQIVKGSPRSQPFFLSPLYPAFLALVYFLSHGSRVAVLLAQGILLSASVCLVGWISRRLLSERLAVASAFVVTFYWSFYYFAGELLPVILCIFFMLAGTLLWVDRDRPRLSAVAAPAVALAFVLVLTYATPGLRSLGRLIRGQALPAPADWYEAGLIFFLVFTAGTVGMLLVGRLSRRAAMAANLLASGTVLGVSMLVWGGTALVTALMALMLLVERPARWARTGLFLLAVAVPLAASLSHNYVISKEIIPITSSFGVNAFIGNNPASDGMDPFKLGEANRVRIEADSLQLSGARRSAFFRRQAARFVTQQPGRALSLLGKKLLISISRFPVDNNADISERRFAWRRFFMPVLHFGVLFPLGMVGTVYLISRFRRAVVLLAGYLAFVAVIVIFFASERFRLPATVFLIPVAAVGAEGLVADALKRNWRRLLISTSIALAACLASNLDYLGLSSLEFPSITVNKAHVQRLSGNMEEARKLLEIALKREPDNAGAYFQLGAIAESQGKESQAITYYLDSLERDPYFYASYTGARRILEEAKVSPSYLDSYVQAVIRAEGHAEAKQRIIDFVARRVP